MKIIFLDIDGVLNSSRSVITKIGPMPTAATSSAAQELLALCGPDELEYSVQFGLNTIDPVCVALLNMLLKKAEESAEVALVLSSTHRRFLCNSIAPFRSKAHLHALRLYLMAMGINVPQFFSITPTLDGIRGLEIKEWFNMVLTTDLHDEYVILDDAADMLPGQPLVRINAQHGFSFSDYEAACKMLSLKGPGLVLL